MEVNALKKRLNKEVHQNIEIEVYDEISSTNVCLTDRAESENLSEGFTMVAKAQTNGIGRYGRCFHSPKDDGIYMSILLKPTNSSKDTISMLTVAAAVACAKAIEAISTKEAKIKWVNDIFVDGKKVAGILAQGKVDNKSGQIDQIVLGVGVNLYEPSEGFHPDIRGIAGNVLDNRVDKAREDYIITFLQLFFSYYKRLDHKEFVSEYKDRSNLIGKKVTVIANGREVMAKVLGFNQDCNLEVEYENGQIEFLESGEVSLRL